MRSVVSGGRQVKMHVTCSECCRLHNPADTSSRNGEWVTVDDSGWCQFTCAYGHEQIIGLNNLKFELLYENGAYALLDGYPREAVATFAAALERYFEFHVTALAVHRGIHGKAFDAAWKSVGNRSERQLGAYLVSHALEFGDAPPTLADKKRPNLEQLRNDVVHNGKMPTEQEAIEFGNEVLQIIRVGIIKLRSLEGQKQGLLAAAFAREGIRRLPARFMGSNFPKIWLPTIATPAMAVPTDVDLSAALRRLKQYRHSWLISLDPRPVPAKG